jgi:hypothetical protein
VGTWTGKVLEPTGEIHEWHEYTLVITPCGRGEACGTWKGEGTSVTTGNAAGCSGTLTFLDAVVLREQADVMGGKLNFTFKEGVSESHGLRYGCSASRDFLEVSPDGTSLRYRVKLWTGDDTFIAEGTLYRAAGSPSPSARPSPTARPSRAPAVPSPAATPPPDLPAAMVGTWEGNPTNAQDADRAGSAVPLRYTLTLKPCSIGEECGQLLIEGVDAAGASMGCTWSMKYVDQYLDVRPGVPQDAVRVVPYLVFDEGQNVALGSWTRVSCSGWGCKDYMRLRPGPVIDFMANCEGNWQEFATLVPAP